MGRMRELGIGVGVGPQERIQDNAEWVGQGATDR